MKVKIKKLSDKAVIPVYQKIGDAGMDLVATRKELKTTKGGVIVEYGTDLSFEIPEGYVGLVFPRSSISKNTGLALGNCVGVIDSGYRGEVIFQFKKAYNSSHIYNVGDRVGQMIIMPFPQIEFEEVNELNSSERGEKGFGSSGT